MKHKHQFAEHATPFPMHARDRLKERYGVDFAGLWHYFGLALRDQNLTIRLSNTREGCYLCACYFGERWFFLICSRDGTVKTVKPPSWITGEDKLKFFRDERYQQINRMANSALRQSKSPEEMKISGKSEFALPSNHKKLERERDTDLIENMKRESLTWWQAIVETGFLEEEVGI